MSHLDLDHRFYDLLLEEAAARTPGLPLEPTALSRRLAPHVVALSKGLTRERALPGARYLDSRDLAIAYLLYYLPVNAWKTRQLLVPWLEREILPADGEMRVADLGCGPGTQLWGLLDALQTARARAEMRRAIPRQAGQQGAGNHHAEPRHDAASVRGLTLHYHAVDHSGPALETLASLARRVGASGLAPGIDLEVTRVKEPLLRPSALPPPGQHLILAGNVLNELAEADADPLARRQAWVETLLERLADGGLLLILEPALKATAGTLSRVRDGLRARADLKVLSPCTHNAPCPLVASGAPGNQWCHQELSWSRPPYIQAIDNLTGLSKERVTLSHLIVQRVAMTESPTGSGAAEDALAGVDEGASGFAQGLEPDTGVRYRALSPSLKARGTVTVHLCGPDGFQEAMLLTRHLNDQNEAFAEIERGDEVRLAGAVEKGRNLRIEAETRVSTRR